MTHRPSLLLALAGVPALLALMPIGGLAALALDGTGELWPHLAAHVLPDALRQTALLLCGTAVVTGCLGVGLAWLVTSFEFRGRAWLEWAVLLPLAMPTYIVAFSYLDVLHPIGPVQGALRALLGIREVRGLLLPDLRSMGGCIFVMGVALYPYVYVTARAALLTQSAEAIEAARGLGASGSALLCRVTLPMALPAIGAGLGLVMLETLADIGASEFLGVRTLTVAVYVTWTTRGSIEGAAQIALAMLALTFLLLALERWLARRRDRSGNGEREVFRVRLRGAWGALAVVACMVPLGLGFGVPALHLLVNAGLRVAEFGLPPALLRWAASSAYLAALATGATLAAGFAVAYCHRHLGSVLSHVALRVSTLGYAIPGTVLAVGIVGPVGGFDDLVLGAVAWLGAKVPGALLSGSIAVLVLAYAVRFLAVPVGMLETAYERIPAGIDEAARGLGARAPSLAGRIHLPLLTPSLTGAALLVMIESMKELPATLLLRPLNVDTLAIAVYAEAARGTYEDGAVAALAIVVLGLMPVILLVRQTQPRRRVEARARGLAWA